MKTSLPLIAGLASLLILAGGHSEASSPPQKDTVKVAGLVVKWVRGDKEANFQRIEPMIREAAAKGAKIVVTTECFLDGYAIADRSIPLKDYLALGEPIPEGKYFQKLAALAAELKIFLVAGMTEADGDTRYNTVVIIGPDGKLVGKYRKQQLGHELGRNTPGKLSPVFPTPFGKMGVVICADRRYPDLVKTICANGADFIICPSGGMFGPKRNDPILQARSKENGIHIVFVHPIEFLVTSPDGSITRREITGDSLLVKPDELNGKNDGKHIFYFDLPVAKVAATATNAGGDGSEKEAAAILKMIHDSQRAGFEKHDFATYIAPWAEDAKVIMGRTKKPDKYDVVMNKAQFAAVRKLLFSLQPLKGRKITFEKPNVKIENGKAVVTYTTKLMTPTSRDSIDEIFFLRKSKGGWKIYRNRSWIVETFSGKKLTIYNEQKWRELDAVVERRRKGKNVVALLEALINAFRLPEAYAVTKKWTGLFHLHVNGWMSRAWVALLNGNAEDCVSAYREALILDPEVPVPDFVKAAK